MHLVWYRSVTVTSSCLHTQLLQQCLAFIHALEHARLCSAAVWDQFGSLRLELVLLETRQESEAMHTAPAALPVPVFTARGERLGQSSYLQVAADAVGLVDDTVSVFKGRKLKEGNKSQVKVERVKAEHARCGQSQPT